MLPAFDMTFVSQAATIKDLLGTVALIALLSVAYGSALRRGRRWPGLWRALLGAAFGGAAALAMFDPLPVAPGVIADLRNLPLAMAGAFLGLEGLAVAAVLAVATRIWIGGAGMLAGSAGLLAAGLLGLLWDRRTRGDPRGAAAIAGLALLLLLHWGCLLLLPAEAARSFLLSALPFVAPIESLGVLFVAALLERERRGHLAVRRLARDAVQDGLTGLLNRRGFEQAVARLPQGREGALLLLDLDHFKRVNDRHGHAAGDAVLRAVGDRLRPVLPAGSLLARLGGEEIAAFLPGQGPAAARQVAQHLCAAVRATPFRLPDGGAAFVTASVGGAPGRPRTLEPMMQRADAALYAAKHAGRDGCRFAEEGPGPDRSLAAGGLAGEGAYEGCALLGRCTPAEAGPGCASQAGATGAWPPIRTRPGPGGAGRIAPGAEARRDPRDRRPLAQ